MSATTINAINTDDGVGLALVLAIEGYDYLITDHDDLAAVITAWAGTDWSKALPGLIAEGEREEEISPWSDEINTGSRVFRVQCLDVYTDRVAGTAAAEQTVTWENIVNCTDNGGGELEKTAVASGWSSGGTSVATITGDGYVTWTVGATNTHILCGLSVGNTDSGITDVDFGIYTRNDGQYFVQEPGGTTKASPGSYTSSTIFKIERVGTTVKTYSDTGSGFVLRYTSLASSTGTLIVDCSFHTLVGAKIEAATTYSADDLVAAVPGSIDSDRFGKVTHADGAGNETYLTASRDPDDASINATNTGDFASSGDAFIGPECFSYTSKTTTLFTGSVNRGKYSPFEADTSTNWGRYHVLPTVDGTNVQTKLIISDEPRTWVGKQVGLWLHRVVGGVLDTKANAHLLFAGTIGAIADTTNNETVLSCDGIRTTLKNTTLLRDQFRGHLGDGAHLATGMQFDCRSYIESGAVSYAATALKVVASGASGSYEVNEGVYTVDEIIVELNRWLSLEIAATRVNATSVNFSIKTSGDTRRTEMDVRYSSTGWLQVLLPVPAFDLMGYESGSTAPEQRIIGVDLNNSPAIAVSQNEPYRVLIDVTSSAEINLRYSTGVWFNNRDWLPSELISGAPSGENWGLLLVGGVQYALCQYSSDVKFIEVKWLNSILSLAAGAATPSGGIRLSDNGEIEVKQIVILHGSLEDIMLRLMASTGASAYNHATYDEWPHHLGAAIPWDLLGVGMTDSLSSLGEATSRNALSIVLEKPTSFEKVIGAELLLRGAFLVWKDQGLQFVQLPTPNSELASHTLTESNKASQAGAIDANRTATETTDQWLRNVIVVKFNRDIITGDYRDTVTIRHESSISRYGTRKVEIEAPNVYGHWSGGLNVIESLIADMGAYMLPMFAEPFKIMHRTIDLSKYLSMHVGDIANVTDLYARDPSTGARGIAGKPSLVLSTSYDLGGYKGAGEPDGMTGKVTLGFAPLDNTPVFAPAGRVDDTATGGGYQADTPIVTQSTITLYANEYSLSGASHDVTHFAAGDEVSISQIDKPDAGAPLEWTATIVSTSEGADEIVLDSLLASFDSSKFYRLTFANYSSCQSTQLSKAFQADADDGKIQDSRTPFVYGFESNSSGQALDLTLLPLRYSLTSARETGDGDALNTGFSHDLAVMANNLVNYKTAPSAPKIWTAAKTGTTSSTVWDLLTSIPFDSGMAGEGGAGLVRKIYVSPLAKIASGSGSVRITVSRSLPRAASLSDVAFVGPQQTTTFTISASTYSTPTAVGLPVVAGNFGIQWIHIETLGTGSVAPVVHGLGTCYLGPLESP